jgi:glutathione S-transferase
VQKVLWALAELGLSYQHVDAGGAAGGTRFEELRGRLAF